MKLKLKKVLLITFSVGVIFSIYFNANFFKFNKIYSTQDQASILPLGKCTSGEGGALGKGTAGSGHMNYPAATLCKGEDFWLPKSVGRSGHGNVGVWGVPSTKNYDGTITNDDYNSSLAPYAKIAIGWGRTSTGYDESHPSFLKLSVRKAIYRLTEGHCIQLCEESGVPECSKGNETLEALYDIGTVWQGVCNSAFKDSVDYQSQKKKIQVDLTDNKDIVLNGRLPASCAIPSLDLYLKEIIAANYSSTEVDSIYDEINDDLGNKISNTPDYFRYMKKIQDCVTTHLKNVLDTFKNLGVSEHIAAFNFNEEGGVTWNFYKLDESVSPSISDKDQAQRDWVQAFAQAIDSYVDQEIPLPLVTTSLEAEEIKKRRSKLKVLWKNKFYVNFYHGRAFHNLVEEAIANDMGIGEHSMQTPYAFSYLQHFKSLGISYNQKQQRYDKATSTHSRVLHTDIEGIHKYHSALAGRDRSDLNTWGQYRLYRMSLLNEISLGYNSFTNTGQLIPSKGSYHEQLPWYLGTDESCESVTDGSITTVVDDRLCNFDYEQIDGEKLDGDGALALYEWSIKMVGRPEKNSPEAYCTFSQSGSEVPSKYNFNNEVTSFRSKWHWEQKSPSASVANNLVVGSEYFNHVPFKSTLGWYYTPKVRAHGRFCQVNYKPLFQRELDQLGISTELNGGRSMDESLIGLTDPTLNKVHLTGSDDVKSYIHEATSLFHSRVKKGAILTQFNSDFVRNLKGDMVLKFTFSAGKLFCNNLKGKSSKDKELRFDVLYPNLDRFEVKTTKTKQVIIRNQELCYAKEDHALDESKNVVLKTFYRPQVFTVSVPLKKSDVDFSQSLVANSNLIIQENKKSDVKVNMMLMRLINVDFQDQVVSSDL